MSEQDLELYYRENLEENIIFCLKSRKGITDDEAMRLYYSSKLCDLISEGEYGIQYLDYHVLTSHLEDELRTINK